MSRKKSAIGPAIACVLGLFAALHAGTSLAAAPLGLDAVSAAVRIMEDDPQFNAGRGAVLTQDGAAEHGRREISIYRKTR